jgi:hypothetical protein
MTYLGCTPALAARALLAITFLALVSRSAADSDLHPVHADAPFDADGTDASSRASGPSNGAGTGTGTGTGTAAAAAEPVLLAPATPEATPRNSKPRETRGPFPSGISLVDRTEAWGTMS